MHLISVILVIVCVSSCASYDEHGSCSADGNNTDIFYKYEKVTDRGCICKENLCIWKCCPLGAAYDPMNKTCVNTAEEFNPELRDGNLRIQNVKATDLFHLKIGRDGCYEPNVLFRMTMFANLRQKDFYLRTDGNLYIEVPTKVLPWMTVGPDMYCIDSFVTDNADGTKTSEIDALVCFPQDEDTSDYLLSSSCMLVSCVFILATVGVYVWLPQLHNIHGRVLIAYLLCLFVGFIFLACMQLLLLSEQMSKTSCLVMTFIIYYALLSAFFWLNVMCFDIWRVFSGKREMRLEKIFVRSKLRAYALYAFGIPTLLTIVLAALHFSSLPDRPWMPMLLVTGCFISGTSKLIYLYGPIVILCVANMTLFVLTALKIAKTKQETSVLNSRDSSRHDQQNGDMQRLFLYVKLFIVMGINWILEVVSALYPNTFFRVTDAYNVLIGLTIFIIFVCKRKIIQLLKERYKQVRRGRVSQGNTSWSRGNLSKDEMTLNTNST